MIRFPCPNCGKRLKFPPEAAERAATCGRCSSRVTLPLSAGQPAADGSAEMPFDLGPEPDTVPAAIPDGGPSVESPLGLGPPPSRHWTRLAFAGVLVVATGMLAGWVYAHHRNGTRAPEGPSVPGAATETAEAGEPPAPPASLVPPPADAGVAFTSEGVIIPVHVVSEQPLQPRPEPPPPVARPALPPVEAARVPDAIEYPSSSARTTTRTAYAEPRWKVVKISQNLRKVWLQPSKGEPLEVSITHRIPIEMNGKAASFASLREGTVVTMQSSTDPNVAYRLRVETGGLASGKPATYATASGPAYEVSTPRADENIIWAHAPPSRVSSPWPALAGRGQFNPAKPFAYVPIPGMRPEQRAYAQQYAARIREENKTLWKVGASWATAILGGRYLLHQGLAKVMTPEVYAETFGNKGTTFSPNPTKPDQPKMPGANLATAASKQPKAPEPAPSSPRVKMSTVSGTVLMRDGSPADGFRVWGKNDGILGFVTKDVQTDSKGRFTLEVAHGSQCTSVSAARAGFLIDTIYEHKEIIHSGRSDVLVKSNKW